MGGGTSGNFGNTRGSSSNILMTKSKSESLSKINSLPSAIQKSTKSFFKGSSNNYTSYSVTHNKNGNYTIKMVNPGRVPGSKAIYYKILDHEGKTLRVYKETFDPTGNLVHIKEK